MLYKLVLLVCLAHDPRPCEIREEMVGDLAMHPATAFMQAQRLVARWIETHPRYQVQQWRLVPESEGTRAVAKRT